MYSVKTNRERNFLVARTDVGFHRESRAIRVRVRVRVRPYRRCIVFLGEKVRARGIADDSKRSREIAPAARGPGAYIFGAQGGAQGRWNWATARRGCKFTAAPAIPQCRSNSTYVFHATGRAGGGSVTHTTCSKKIISGRMSRYRFSFGERRAGPAKSKRIYELHSRRFNYVDNYESMRFIFYRRTIVRRAGALLASTRVSLTSRRYHRE